MMLPSLQTSLIVGACVFLGCGPGTAQEPAAAAPQEKNVSSEDPVAAIEKFIADQKIDKTKEGWKTRLPKPPKVAFDAKKEYYWKLETNVGNLKIKLMPDVAPMHVSSTIYLTKLGFYDDILFHRVIQGFMAQGGCPLSHDPARAGTGSPGYDYAGEFKADVRHDKGGKLSMANRGPNTDGSQFFLTFVPTPHLDGKHTIFGTITEGADTTLKELEKRGSQTGKTKEPLSITKATIEVVAAK